MVKNRLAALQQQRQPNPMLTTPTSPIQLHHSDHQDQQQQQQELELELELGCERPPAKPPDTGVHAGGGSMGGGIAVQKIDSCPAHSQECCINTTNASSRLFVIQTWVQGQEMATLLDDGSMINIISPKIVQQLGLQPIAAHTISIRQFQSVEVVRCDKQVHLSLGIKNASGQGKQKLDILPFWVCDLGDSFQCLIGMPAHVSMSVQKSYTNRKVTFSLASGR
jgi:hypothetical protein